MKLWEKIQVPPKAIWPVKLKPSLLATTEMDMYLAAFDVMGSLAHIEMLESVGLLEKQELMQLQVN